MACHACGRKGTNYGPPGGKAQWCRACSLERGGTRVLGMCEACGTKRANYGRPGEKKVTWCAPCGRQYGAVFRYEHKLPRCQECGVVKSPKYGLPGGKAQWCKACGDKHGAVRLVGLCVECGQVSAMYGIPGKGCAKWCAACAVPHGGEVLYARRCKQCGITYMKGAHTVCTSCDTSASRPSRVREKQVAKWLADAGVQWTTWDKQLPERACGRYRPDFTFECAGHVVVLEVDELEHARPGYECDNRRMLDVYNAYGGTPVVFVRYNPDTPTFDDKKRKFTAQRRKQVLLSELRAALAQPPQHALCVVRLFYSWPDECVVRATHVDPYDAGFTEQSLCKSL